MMNDNFKLRTITAFIDRKNVEILSRFSKETSLFEDNGIPVRTSRVALDFRDFQDDSFVEFSQLIEELGFWGYCISFDDPLEKQQITAAKKIISETVNGFANFSLTDSGRSLDSNHVEPCVDLIKAVSERNNGIDNFRLGFSFGLDNETPFFPYSKKLSTEGFSVGIEYVDICKEIIAKNSRKPMDIIREELLSALGNIVEKIMEICAEIENKSGLEFLGVDLSLAPYPYPLEDQSIVDLIETLGNIGRSRGDREFRFGMSGSMFLHTFITSVIKEIERNEKYKTTGFNGVMYSLLEDTGLSKRFADGSIGLSDLLLTSTTCGCGVDMVPIADIGSKKVISSIFFDVYAISLALNKPLGIRMLPIPNSRPGDQTSFRHLFFSNTTLAEVSSGISFNHLPAQMSERSSVTLTKRGDGNFE
tara:strand:- start:21805 stop:23061 length:1257 start_codon:yes stop_codon:yes gene_type:complete